MARNSNYDKRPCVSVSSSASECWVGWTEIIDRLRPITVRARSVLCVECYPGSFEADIRGAVESGLTPAQTIYTPDLLKPANKIDKMLSAVLGNDPVFGQMNEIGLEAFFDEAKLQSARDRAASWQNGLLLVVGAGAGLVAVAADVLVYADMARWEIQGRQRRNQIPNFGSNNYYESPS